MACTSSKENSRSDVEFLQLHLSESANRLERMNPGRAFVWRTGGLRHEGNLARSKVRQMRPKPLSSTSNAMVNAMTANAAMLARNRLRYLEKSNPPREGNSDKFWPVPIHTLHAKRNLPQRNLSARLPLPSRLGLRPTKARPERTNCNRSNTLADLP